MRYLTYPLIATLVICLTGCFTNQKPPVETAACPAVASLKQLCPSSIKTDGKAMWFRGISLPYFGNGTSIGDITYTSVELQKLSDLATELDQQNIKMCMVLEAFRGSKNGTTAELIQLVESMNNTEQKANQFVSIATSSKTAKQAAPNEATPAAAAIASITEIAQTARAEVINATASLPPIDPAMVVVPEGSVTQEASE